MNTNSGQINENNNVISFFNVRIYRYVYVCVLYDWLKPSKDEDLS